MPGVLTHPARDSQDGWEGSGSLIRRSTRIARRFSKFSLLDPHDYFIYQQRPYILPYTDTYSTIPAGGGCPKSLKCNPNPNPACTYILIVYSESGSYKSAARCVRIM